MRIAKRLLSYILFLLIVIHQVDAQENNDFKDNSKEETKESYLFWGGSLWLSFGTYTYVDVNVIFGTQLTERLSLGLSGKYQYYNDKRAISGNFETSVYGGSIFSQFAVVKDFRNLIKVKGHSGIIAHVEYEFLNTEYNYLYFNVPDLNYDRYWLHNILIGGGYFHQMGRGSKSYIILLWNVNETGDNPYIYPQIRIGFSIAI
ncbi:MAG: hypothetical protein KAQ75_02355 [Bacteroidales bacterium]|nr:hypothetical protein [Bacteroidales bacterium]